MTKGEKVTVTEELLLLNKEELKNLLLETTDQTWSDVFFEEIASLLFRLKNKESM